MSQEPCPGTRAAGAAWPHLPGEHTAELRYSLSIVAPLPGVLCPEDVPSQRFRIFPILVILIFVLSSQSLDFFEKVSTTVEYYRKKI